LTVAGSFLYREAGENLWKYINVGKNPMAAQMACIELEKQLTFIALTG
jgi:hypothetical protein